MSYKNKIKKATCSGTIQRAIFLNFLPTFFFYCFSHLFSLFSKFSHTISLLDLIFFQNFLLLFLSPNHFFSQMLKNKIFKKNTIVGA
jgi:hypothetical protein